MIIIGLSPLHSDTKSDSSFLMDSRLPERSVAQKARGWDRMNACSGVSSEYLFLEETLQYLAEVSDKIVKKSVKSFIVYYVKQKSMKFCAPDVKKKKIENLRL